MIGSGGPVMPWGVAPGDPRLWCSGTKTNGGKCLMVN